MRYKLSLLLVTTFFITMNVLLWRSEFGARGRLGTPLPAETVWEKVLTSPDNSFLEMRHKGVKIGRAHWSATINEAPAASLPTTDDGPPEGMVKTVTGYALNCEGTVSLEDLSRVRFDFTIKFDTNQSWREIFVKISIKPFVWEIRSSAATETLRFTAEDDEGRRDQTYRFSELQNPEKIVKALGGPLMPAFLALSGLPSATGPDTKAAQTNRMSLGLRWEAHNDGLKVGRIPIRVYRIEAKIFDRFRAVFFVSPVGEILRVELPDDVVLMNEAVMSLAN
ncbi:MAG: hypothetical protein QOF48_403 [Verrucomicrobiota bacterium]|jgi:hypothetical protein